MSSHGLFRRCLCAAFLVGAPLPAGAATVSGSITSPTSDNGYRAALDDAVVRVEGTTLSAPVVITDSLHATFTLHDVPMGPVTLRLEERAGYDSFTHASVRRPLAVTGDLAGVTFALQYHWQRLPTYPPPWRDANYDLWQPFFLSDQVGFLLFWGRWLDTQPHELWRTVDGGASWSRIGLWFPGTSPAVPTQSGEQAVFFFDADHGVVTAAFGPPNYAVAGLLWTADGGATWTPYDLPNTAAVGPLPPANGLIRIDRYAAIDAARGIACGVENVGTSMGSGAPGYVTAWETADAGATWAIATGWPEDYGTCSALGATPDGHAILFDTPYAFGGTRRLALREPGGSWTQVPGNDLVTNSGYGGADVPMIGATAWVRAQRFEGAGGEIDRGLYRSDDHGATWSKMSELLPLYFGFATPRKGFALGGRAVATYDGGLSWLHQSDGGGVCCHGNHVWVFGPTRAIWHEGGPGDPNGLSDLFTYVEPPLPDLEVRGGVTIPDRELPARVAAPRVPVLSLRLDSHGPVALRLHRLSLQASGTGDDGVEVEAVRLWLDADGDGVVGAGDVELAHGAFPADDGRLQLDLPAAPLLEEYQPLSLLLTCDLPALAHRRTFSVAVASADVGVETSGSGEVVQVAATAPPGTWWRGATLTVTARADLQVAQADAPDPATVGEVVTYAVTVRNAGPDDAAQVQLTDTLPAGVAFVSATPGQGSCTHASGTVSCTLGDVASGATATVAVAVRPAAAGSITNQAAVTATEPDPVPGNGASAESTTVQAVPAPRKGGGCGCGSAPGGDGLALLLGLWLVPALLRGAGRARRGGAARGGRRPARGGSRRG